MTKFSNRRSAAMMTSASVLALGALASGAQAQQTIVGAPGSAMTTGTITTTTGRARNGFAGSGVQITPGAAAVVTATGAVIDERANIFSDAFAIDMANGIAGPLTVNILPGTSIQGWRTAVGIITRGQNVTLNATNGTFISTAMAGATLNLSGTGDIAVQSSGNAITSNAIGLSAVTSGANRSVVVNSTGGAIGAANGIIAESQGGGAVFVGQGAGVTTAINLARPVFFGGTGISASSGLSNVTPGAISVRTGIGGTINGGVAGIVTNAQRGATTINVGAAIGGSIAPTGNGVLAITNGGGVTISNTAAITAGQVGIVARVVGANGVVGGIAVSSSANVTANRPVVLAITNGGTGGIDYSLTGPNTLRSTSDGYAIEASASSGAINITSATGSTVTSLTRAVDASTTAGGSINLNLAGQTNGSIYGRVAGGNGSVTINTATANAVGIGARAISATTTNGAISVNATGAVSGSQTGIYSFSTGTGSTIINVGGSISSNSTSFFESGGVYARNIGTGSVSLGSASQRLGAITGTGTATAGQGTTGIDASAGGDMNVFATTVATSGRGILASSTVNGATVVDVSGLVTAGSGTGILAQNSGRLASNTISVRTANVVANDVGVGTSSNGGATSIRTGSVTGINFSGISGRSRNGGNISVVSTGPIVGGQSAIDLQATGASATGGMLSFDSSSTVRGRLQGLYMTSEGSGGVNIGQTTRIGDITATEGTGVFATSAGDVNIAVGAVTANRGFANESSGFGIIARSTRGGSVSIDATGPVIGGAADGIRSETSTTGAVTIRTAAVTANAGQGINATSVAGPISITTTGPINASSFGVRAVNNGAGTIRVLAAGPINSTNHDAILAQNSGLGTVMVGMVDNRIGRVTANRLNGIGITAIGNDDVSVHASSVSSGLAGIVAASQGAALDGIVTVNTDGTINANSGFGIIAVNNGASAANTLSVIATGPIVSRGGSGISAQAAGGDITIRSGAITANSAANGTWDGIFAEGRRDSLVTVTTTGAVSGTFRGIDVSSTGTTARSGVAIVAEGNVTGGFGQAAIVSNVNGRGNTSITTGAGTTLNAAVGTGIQANVATTTGANDIAINNRAAIGGAGTGRVLNGISASIDSATNAGSIAINASGGAIQAIAAGIVAATAGTGSVDIGGISGIDNALITPGVGIAAQTTSGTLAIRTATTGTIAPGAVVGIQARTTTGAITINQGGAIGAAGAGNAVGLGIDARIASGTAGLTIKSDADVYVSAGTGLQSAGIFASHGGTGAIDVVSTGLIDPGAYGVVLQGGGNVSYAADGGLVEGGQGVFVASTGAGTASVSSRTGTTITGLSGVGVQAAGAGGAVSIGTAGAVTGATSGIVATNTGAGATSVATTGAVTGRTGDGINVSSGAGVLMVTTAGSVFGANSGVVALSSGVGSTNITNTGVVASDSGPAISATSGTGGLALNVRGNVISATGPAILANSASGAVIDISSGAMVAGRIDNPTEAVIQLNTASGSSSTVNVAQGATLQTVSGSSFSTAIRATGGSITVNNSGVISGQIDFSALTGDNTGQLAGGAGTVFQTGGLSVFGAGNDTFTNAGQLISVGSTTTFDFRGGTNVFDNSGTVFVGFNPAMSRSSTFVLSSLTNFNNAGSLNLMNGVLGDSIVAPGAVFVGRNASRLMLDTAIGASGSGSDFLTVGSSSGRTSVLIRDTAPTAFGAYNPTGTVLVNGLTNVGDFVLDASSSFYNAGVFGGALDKPGLFFSQLGVNGAGATVLVSLPKVQAYQFSTLASQAQAVWYETGPRASRQAEVRNQLISGKGAGGFWVDVQGSRANRDVDRHAATLAGVQRYDASYSQDLTSTTIGIDAIRNIMEGSAVFGASVGYVTSGVDFDKQSTSIDMDGWSASVYTTFVRSGWFVAGTVGANQLNTKIKAPRLAGFMREDTDITSLGGTVEVGFQAPFILGAVIEPSGALAFVSSKVDDFAAAGATFRFGDDKSLRPSLGARISGETEALREGWTTLYNVSVRGVGEALSRNDVIVENAGLDLRVYDQFDDAYGEVKAGLTSQSINGWSVFGDLTARYSDEYRAVGASVGFRIQY